jgi:hypothetical protein
MIRLPMDLHVKFDGSEIIVTRPGTEFMLAYRKAPDGKITAWAYAHDASPQETSDLLAQFDAIVVPAYQRCMTELRVTLLEQMDVGRPQ